MVKNPSQQITADSLERSALHYLERFATSSANLRRVLFRKIDRVIAQRSEERADYAPLVEALLVKLTQKGYLDDALFAENRAMNLHRRGKATRAIRAALATKGLGIEEVEIALRRLAAETENVDIIAAAQLARKRKLGPYREEEVRAEMRKKDLGVLARAGFDGETARRVVDAESVEDLFVDEGVKGP